MKFDWGRGEIGIATADHLHDGITGARACRVFSTSQASPARVSLNSSFFDVGARVFSSGQMPIGSLLALGSSASSWSSFLPPLVTRLCLVGRFLLLRMFTPVSLFLEAPLHAMWRHFLRRSQLSRLKLAGMMLVRLALMTGTAPSFWERPFRCCAVSGSKKSCSIVCSRCGTFSL